MLKLINVCKGYKFGKNYDVILDNVSLDFKKEELVFILGESGSGKSTLLNIIGGLIDVDAGKVMLDDKDITKFNNRMLCNYRNNMVGYIFQDYHLVEYMSVLDNIKLGLTVKNNNGDIEDILRKMGIYSKRKTLVNKLSGGEKQRVAIARAIINNPEIILCDEPTGALDSINSKKIMKILKDISKNKLVIVVSHDEKLAMEYGDRIVRINDGKIDYEPVSDDCKFKKIENKKISLFKIIKLAIKNISLKKGRTLFTSLAISIGLVCMIMVLCLSKSFNDDIVNMEKDIVGNYPISVYNGEFEKMDYNDTIDNNGSNDGKIIRDNKDGIHKNKISIDYMNYLKNIDEISYLSYDYDISMPVISDRYKIIDNKYMKMNPGEDYLSRNYEILYGDKISNYDEIVLKVDSKNRVSSEILDMFLIDGDIEYSDIVGRKLSVILNDMYYVKNEDYYFIDSDLEKLYKNSEFELKIVGVVKEKDIINDESYFYYSDGLIDTVLDENSKSEIVLDQMNRDDNVLGIEMNRYELLSYLGYESLPNVINIYVDDMDDKKIVLDKLDKYNEDNGGNGLIYVDTMNDVVEIIRNIIMIITVILVVFSLVSIFVSSLMIFILTNNRVMERIKEIGILRSLGARKIDVVRLFNIENFIIGVISSIMGLVIVKMLDGPINSLMYLLIEDNSTFKLYSGIIITCILFNIFIVILSGYIPSVMAGRREIIDCIRNR